jgi:hypothetical protein
MNAFHMDNLRRTGEGGNRKNTGINAGRKNGVKRKKEEGEEEDKKAMLIN